MTAHDPAADPQPLIQAALAGVARLERAGERPARLTDPEHARWRRFARRLGWRDSIELLFQDLSGAFPTLFKVDLWRPHLAQLTAEQAELLIRRVATPSEDAPDAFLRAQASALGLCAAGALSDLPALQPRHRILELPGAPGRIAAYALQRDRSLSLDGQFTFVVGSDAERILLGLAVVELRANPPTVWTPAEAVAQLPKARFDRIFGLKGADLPAWASELPVVRL